MVSLVIVERLSSEDMVKGLSDYKFMRKSVK